MASASAPARWRATQRRACRRSASPVRGVLLVLALASGDTFAQVSGSLTALSNYRYRGVSLSDNDPAAQVTLVYDDPRGWYAGAFASTARIGYPTSSEAQGVFFAGYAHTAEAGVTFEAGVVYSAFTGPASYGYADLLVGVTYDRLTARVHYAPNYYGAGIGALYAEADAAHRLLQHVQAVAHAGVLRTSAKSSYSAAETVFDARIGLVFDFDRVNVQLSWVGISSATTGYGLTGVRSRNGPVLAVSWLF